MAKETLLTSEGLAKLENELEELKTIRRKEVADKIKVAISFGDLSENSEYDEAKNEQAMIEARILQIEAMLKNVKLLDAGALDTETVNLGSKVKANPDQGKISDESPIGKNLLGHRVGDIVAIPVPNGTVTYKILDIMM